MDTFDEPGAIARLARCAAALYAEVPREGGGLAKQAEEFARAAELDLLALTLESGADVDLDHVLRPGDVRAVCQLLIDVRRNPSDLSPIEVRIAREHFPEVEEDSLASMEALIRFFTGLLRDR